MQKSRLESLSLSVLFVGVSLLLFFIFAPFLPLLCLAVVFAILLHQPYERLVRVFKGRKNIAATITVGLMLILFIVPLFLLGWQILQETRNLYGAESGNEAQYLHLIQNAIQSPIRYVFPEFSFNISAYVGNTLGFISSHLGLLVYQALYIVLQTFLMLLALFFFLRDGRQLLASFAGASPLEKKTTHEVLTKAYLTIGSVIQGTLVNAIIRFILIWVAFYAFGIPNALLWSSIGGIVGAIPGLGTPFAFIPAVAYLYFEGNILFAVGLAVFGIAVILFVDNILTSYFFSKGLTVSPLFILFSILGGVVFFGPLGFILGPLALSVFLTVIHAYGLVERES